MSDVRMFWVNNNQVRFRAESTDAKKVFVELWDDIDVVRNVTPDLRKELREELESYGLTVEGD